VTKGSATLAGKDLLALEAEERSHAGLFVSWQYPVEVPGVANAEFLRLAYNSQRKARGQPEVATKDFPPLLARKVAEARIPAEFAERQLNAGMSGGQKKRNEILQLHMLEPTVAVLDETDSGLDIDALKAVGEAINAYRRADRAIVLITHFQRLLELVKPDRVHVLTDGRIQESGDVELAGKLERDGYDWIVRG
jgi:Fe-S cluster assembly ATP-binding protein